MWVCVILRRSPMKRSSFLFPRLVKKERGGMGVNKRRRYKKGGRDEKEREKEKEKKKV